VFVHYLITVVIVNHDKIYCENKTKKRKLII
jgi:hypothetical protein